MKLQELLKGVAVLSSTADGEAEIGEVRYDSRAVGKGDLFVAIRGYATDGHKYIEKALEQGAAAVVCEEAPEGAPAVVVENSRKALAEIAANRFGHPADSMVMLGVTGTNGKTTTTTLVGEIMSAYKPSVFVVGNIGNPYTDIAMDTREDSVVVAEISSFQLETIHTFAPKVSAILNITPDHLNRHHTMECYVETKERIASNQTKEDVCVLNYEDAYTRTFGEKCPAKVVFFSSKRELADGLFLRGEEIMLAENGKVQRLMNIHEMNLVGLCNVENVMAAIAICRAMDVPMDVILATVRQFKAVEHRIEFVATKNGVDYYNDSKGTNPDAAIQGIRAMTKPTILIGGGYDKQSEYDEWIENFDGKVKALVLIGQTRDKIAECARKHGFSNIILADTFEEAFQICVQNAVPGDAVLLSPACASWGMFPNYEVRGKMFKEMVYNYSVQPEALAAEGIRN